jgi:hypothetical protein
VVSDLSGNIARAIADLPACVKPLLCHYHFLENLGKKLLQRHHAELSHRLNQAKLRPRFHSLRSDLAQYIRNCPRKGRRIAELLEHPKEVVEHDPVHGRRSLAYLLLSWLDDHATDLQGERFPFDQPALALYRRARKLYEWLRHNVEDSGLKRSERKTLQTIVDKLATVVKDPSVTTAAERLEKALNSFNRVRRALRFQRRDRKPIRRAQPPASTVKQAQNTECRLRKLHHCLLKRAGSSADPEAGHDARIVLTDLDKYWDKLHGHLIRLPHSNRIILVERTNNCPEHRFGGIKRGWRRRLGTAKLGRRMQAARPAEMLVANLDSQQYLDLCYQGNIRNMPAVFAQHWAGAKEIRDQRNQTPDRGIMYVPKAALRHPSFFGRMKQALRDLAACFV